MLIKYETCVINLDNVTEFYCCQPHRIKFIFDSYDQNNSETAYSFFDFDSDEEREEAFKQILMNFDGEFKVCILD